MCLAPEGQGKWILYICMLVPWGWAKRAGIFFKEIRPMETKPRWKFVLVEMKPIYLRLRDKPYFGGNGAENPCLSVSKKKVIKVLMEILWMLKDEKEVMLLLLSNTYTRTKFSRVTMNSQNQEPPLNASTTVPHCCQQLFLSISSYTKKNSSQKVCNRYILSFQTKVGNRSIYDNKVSCFISSFNCFCCVPILYWKSWSFLLVVEHQ